MKNRNLTEKLRGLSRKKKIALTCVAVCLVLLYFFPVYRLFTVALPDHEGYYEKEDVVHLYFMRGTPGDLWQARTVIKQGRAAFEDCTTPCDQMEEKHGPLYIYGTERERGAVKARYSLRLLSAHLDERDGKIWVKYSYKALDKKGEVICGSLGVVSLWTVQKDAQGVWRVVDVREHP